MQNTKFSDAELDQFLDEAEKTNQTLIDNNEKILQEIDDIVASVSQATSEIDRICNEIDQAEKNTTDKIDRLILEESELWVDNNKE